MESCYICLLTTKRGRRTKSYGWRTEKEEREIDKKVEKLREIERWREREIKEEICKDTSHNGSMGFKI